MAADLSCRLGWIEPSLLHRTKKLLQQAELPIAPPKVRFLLPMQVISLCLFLSFFTQNRSLHSSQLFKL